jgi:putative addiction module component (TIGR02574 family)
MADSPNNYLRLSTAHRLVLIQDLLESVLAEVEAPPFTPEQIEELDRRCEAVDTGLMRTHLWDDVKHRSSHAMFLGKLLHPVRINDEALAEIRGVVQAYEHLRPGHGEEFVRVCMKLLPILPSIRKVINASMTAIAAFS